MLAIYNFTRFPFASNGWNFKGRRQALFVEQILCIGCTDLQKRSSSVSVQCEIDSHMSAPRKDSSKAYMSDLPDGQWYGYNPTVWQRMQFCWWQPVSLVEGHCFSPVALLQTSSGNAFGQCHHSSVFCCCGGSDARPEIWPHSWKATSFSKKWGISLYKSINPIFLDLLYDSTISWQEK